MMHSHNSRSLHTLVFAFALVLVVGCGDDDGPTGGTPDTTPPSVSSVDAVDVYHIDVTYNENVQRESAEDLDNYVIVETTVALAEMGAAPGDTLTISGASLSSDNRTVSLSTGPMLEAPYDMSVTGVKDASGNAIVTPVVNSFTGSTDPDATAPELVYRSPGPNATGVPIGASIVLAFSEVVNYDSFINGFSLSSSAGNVPYTVESDDNGIHVVVSPNSLLDMNTRYTVALVNISDEWSNIMPNVSWSFRTTNVTDTTPPNLVLTVPLFNTTNVDVNTVLSITYNEPIDQASPGPSLYPSAGPGDAVWSNGGKTITFTPDFPLHDDQQYTLALLPGAIEDLAGNTNTSFIQIRFTTGSAFENGGFEGTLVGDPGSDYAVDPTGAWVFAIPALGPFLIAGSGIVGGNHAYDIFVLADDDYNAFSLMDSNDDGILDNNLGDAIGGYGIDFDTFDLDPDVIEITGGSDVTGIDFQLFDFSAITGMVNYTGVALGTYYIGIGLFGTVGFDPTDEPLFTTSTYWPDFPSWGFINYYDGVLDASYYVGAYLDYNENATYDVGTDPIGFYGGAASPTAVSIQDGSDVNGIVITIEDPPTANATGSVAWREHTVRARPAWFSKLAQAVQASDAHRAELIGTEARREREADAPAVHGTGWSR